MPLNETNKEKFSRLLNKYITFRGIDIVLYLADGTVVELDKNRHIEGDKIFKKDSRQKVEMIISVEEIEKAEIFAA